MVREIPFRRELASLVLLGLVFATRTSSAQAAKEETAKPEKEATKVAAVDERSVLIVDMKAAVPEDEAAAKAVIAALAMAAHQSGLHLKLVTTEKAGLPASLAACEDDKCVADAVKSEPFDFAIAARVGTNGEKKLVFASLVDTKTGSVKGRTSVTLMGEKAELANELKPLVTQLFDPAVQAATGEVLAPFSEMRVAVLVDEYQADDKAVDPETLEPCLNRHFSDAMVQLVSPAEDERINRMVDAKLLLQTGVPETLATDAVDLLVAGVVKYSAGPEMQGFVSASADMSLQLLRVDTGEALVSADVHGRGPGGNTAIANRAAALQLCGQANENIKRALSKRMDRGRRLTVQVSGHVGADTGQDVVDQITKLPRVVSARLRNVGDASGTIDVAMSGGDGVLLALEIKHAGLALKLGDVAPGTLKLTHE